MMWLVAIGCMLGGIGILAARSAGRRGRHMEQGAVSQRWLSEHRAGSRY
jgi:hypothetical protein